MAAMSNFYVGQKVVYEPLKLSQQCRDFIDAGGAYPERGAVYTVRSVRYTGSMLLPHVIHLDEIDNSGIKATMDGSEMGFIGRDFRPALDNVVHMFGNAA